MSFRDNQDLRPRGAGGWCYAEHELFSLFAPLIGPNGVSVYMAFCRLIPLAAIHADRQVTVRRMSEYSTVSRSECAEKMQQIYRLGMVIETKYLDGRNPTYKLPSLHELAKVGQAELFRRAGVRPEDTAPYDQEAKHRRDQAKRAAKRQKAANDTGLGRSLPLLDDGLSLLDDVEGEAGDSEGVRTADTARHDAGERSDLHSVSAESVTVSANPVSVSAESVTVSATRGPLIEGKGSEVKNKNPLPPAEQGESEDDGELARPVLPNPECTFGQPGFAANLPIAAGWVMAQSGVTKRRLEPVIVAQLELFCRQHRGETLEDAAWAMARQSRKLHQDAKLLRHAPWGWNRWFAEGHWQRPLPYDPAKLGAQQATEDAPTEAETKHDPLAKRVAYVEGLASTLRDAGCVPVTAGKLEELSRAAAGGLGMAALDTQLQLLEDEMVDELVAAATADEMAGFEAAALRELSQARARMTPDVQAEAKQRLIARSLMRAHKLPNLGLFHMLHK